MRARGGPGAPDYSALGGRSRIKNSRPAVNTTVVATIEIQSPAIWSQTHIGRRHGTASPLTAARLLVRSLRGRHRNSSIGPRYNLAGDFVHLGRKSRDRFTRRRGGDLRFHRHHGLCVRVGADGGPPCLPGQANPACSAPLPLGISSRCARATRRREPRRDVKSRPMWGLQFDPPAPS
jgi:hypothetical protein